MPDEIRLDDLIELPKFIERYSDVVDEPRMRWQIFNRESNGLADSGAVVKRLGRWFVVVPKYRDWLLRGPG